MSALYVSLPREVVQRTLDALRDCASIPLRPTPEELGRAIGIADFTADSLEWWVKTADAAEEQEEEPA